MRINKEIEQGIRSLIALSDEHELLNARQLSEKLNIPYEKLSKILQKLNRNGVIEAERGRHGGYRLLKDLNDLSMADMYTALEQEEELVPCLGERNCRVENDCSIRSGLVGFQKEWITLLRQTRISDLAQQGGAL